MTELTSEKLTKQLQEIIPGNPEVVMNPKDYAELLARGVAIREVTVSNEEFISKLLSEAEETAKKLVKIVPRLDIRVASGLIAGMYDNMRKAYLLGLPGQAINISAQMVEMAAKIRIYREMSKENPKYSWSKHIEGRDLQSAVTEIRKLDIISEPELAELLKYKTDVRNAYTHHKVQTLVKRYQMKMMELKQLNIKTGEVETSTNVDVATNPILWNNAKKKIDQETFVDEVAKAMEWVHLLLLREKPQIFSQPND